FLCSAFFSFLCIMVLNCQVLGIPPFPPGHFKNLKRPTHPHIVGHKAVIKPFNARHQNHLRPVF
ncbi:hypothetical protein HMI55_002254, partial [Coelomomyces lativittatus]